jgi:intracellular septation protein A
MKAHCRQLLFLLSFFVTQWIGVGKKIFYVVYQFNPDTWVNFKLFGMLGLTWDLF